MVVAQLADRSLPTPEIRGSTLAINSLNVIIGQSQSRKDESKEKDAGNGPIKKSTRRTPAKNQLRIDSSGVVNFLQQFVDERFEPIPRLAPT